MWEAYTMCHWCDAMALQLDSGLTLSDALNLTAQISPGDLQTRTVKLKEALMNGELFWLSMRSLAFPSLVVALVRAGEESGQLPRSLGWLGNLYELNFRTTIERLAQLVEPLVIFILGTLAGGLMLMTLLPMAKAIGNL
jgi:type II secretory pathway component PulF